MQEQGEHVVVDVEHNEMTGTIDVVVEEDIRLRRNNYSKTGTWAEFQERAFSCGVGGALWMYVTALTFLALFMSHDFIIQYWMWERFKIDKSTVGTLSAIVIVFFVLMVALVFEKYRGMPYRTVGRFGRGVVDLLTLGSAIIVRMYFPDHGIYHASQFQLFFVSGPLQVLLLVTMHVHGWGQALHLLSDVGKRDMMLGAVMQVLIYVSSKTLQIYLDIFFCFVILYRICNYEVPTTPDLVKKDLRLLPS